MSIFAFFRERKDRAYCRESEDAVRKHMGPFLDSHSYRLEYLGRFGRYRSECLFGAQATGLPRLIFGGELGPSAWIGPPDAPWSGLYDERAHWFNVAPLADFMLDRGQTWLDLTEDPTKYEMSRVASDIRSLWPLAAPVLSDPIRLHDLKAKFETWANTAIEEYWGPIR